MTNQSQPSHTSGMAIASMVLGIVSYVLCLLPLTGIPAIILGHIALGKIRSSNGTIGGNGMAIAGLVMGGFLYPVLGGDLFSVAAGLFAVVLVLTPVWFPAQEAAL